MKTCAVIIAAYNAEKYIIECINSVKKQIQPDDFSIEIRIGVDGCTKTAEILKKHNIPFYWSENNLGAYVIRNSLINIDLADKYVIFDADDVMFSDYIKKTLQSQYCVTMTAKINCDEDLKPITGARIEYGGAITFDNNVLNDLGGYHGVRCAADSDFMDRLKMKGYEIHKINEPLYYRRIHPNSLTKKPDTGMGSAYRNKVWAEMTEKRNQGIIKIIPETISLTKIYD